jgi:hypothetical protein
MSERKSVRGSCGSAMLFESSRWPGEPHVAPGCIEDPVDRVPEANAFVEAHVAWMPLDESLRRYEG